MGEGLDREAQARFERDMARPLDPQQEVACALQRIEGRLEDGDKRFDAMDEHVKDCAASKRKVEDRLAALERKMTWPIWLPFAGSVIVALAIVFD